MRTPIVVMDGGPLFFATVQDAEQYFEPIDVRDGLDVVYDASGTRLRMEIVVEPRPVLFGLLRVPIEVVRLGLPESAPRAQDATSLAETLATYLRERNRAVPSTGTDNLQALIDACIAHFGMTR
jgi:hypothetical protein